MSLEPWTEVGAEGDGLLDGGSLEAVCTVGAGVSVDVTGADLPVEPAGVASDCLWTAAPSVVPFGGVASGSDGDRPAAPRSPRGAESEPLTAWAVLSGAVSAARCKGRAASVGALGVSAERSAGPDCSGAAGGGAADGVSRVGSGAGGGVAACRCTGLELGPADGGEVEGGGVEDGSGAA